MLKVICDYCGEECDRNAFDIRVGILHNPVPMYMNDSGEATITDDNTRIRFVLCQKCYREKFKLPNIYMCSEKNRIVWQDEEEGKMAVEPNQKEIDEAMRVLHNGCKANASNCDTGNCRIKAYCKMGYINVSPGFWKLPQQEGGEKSADQSDQ